MFNQNSFYTQNYVSWLWNTSEFCHIRPVTILTLKVLNFWKLTSYCSLKPLWLGMGEVVPARTSPTLHPPSPPTVHQLSWLALWELICILIIAFQQAPHLHLSPVNLTTKENGTYRKTHIQLQLPSMKRRLTCLTMVQWNAMRRWTSMQWLSNPQTTRTDGKQQYFYIHFNFLTFKVLVTTIDALGHF